MTDDIVGEIRSDGALRAVKITHTLSAPHMAVWDAISHPDQLSQWFATVTGEFTEGGAIEIDFDPDDATQRTPGTIVECRPPRRLVVSWTFPNEPESYVYVDLLDEEDRTELTLDHQQVPLASTVGYAAGWQTYVEQLVAHLAGTQSAGPKWDDRWNELRPTYEEQFNRLG